MKKRASSLSAARPKTPAVLRRKVLVVHRRLLKQYGEPEPPARRGDALGELIACILSQHTSDLNSGRAYESLRARFPTWELVRDAPPRAVVAAIRSSGLANQKGPRIQSVLRTISRDVASSHARGGATGGEPVASRDVASSHARSGAEGKEPAASRDDPPRVLGGGTSSRALDINFLADWPVPEAKAWLQALHGVGPKTAAITLLFGLGLPAFPVDTHVHRVAGRLGLIPGGSPAGSLLPAGTTRPAFLAGVPQVAPAAVQRAESPLPADRAHDALEAIVPPRLFYPFHMNLIRHGRTLCQARRPKCDLCPLTGVCDYYLERT